MHRRGQRPINLAKNLPSYVGLEDATVTEAYEDRILGGGLSVDDLREDVFGRDDGDTSQSQMKVSVAVGQGLNDLRVDRELEWSRSVHKLEKSKKSITGDFRG